MTNKQAKLVLGIDINKSFTIEELTKRYRNLMKKNHPDMHANESEKAISTYNRKCSLINEAYEKLKSSLEDTKCDDYEFIHLKEQAINEIKSIFENCSDSVLKQSIENAYHKNIFIDEINDIIELDSAVEKFYSILKIYYKNYEISYRRQNGIPKKFDYNLRYDCNTDEFMTELSMLEQGYEEYIDNKINGIIYTYFGACDNVILSSYLDNRIDGIKYLLHNYNLFDYEEIRAFDDFREFIKDTYSYYETISDEYLFIKRLIDKLPGNYNDLKCDKSKLLSKLNDSVYKHTFDNTKDEIMSKVYEYQDKEKAVERLHKYLTMKSVIVSSHLKMSRDKSKLDYVYHMMSVCNNLLKMTLEGKYSIKDISILENITFNNEETDKMLLSILNNKGYSIYVKIPNKEIDKLYNPFVLKNNDDEFLSVNGEEVTLESSESIKKDNQLYSLSDIINYGTPVFRYTTDGETIDNVLYQYNGYDLVINYDVVDGTINDFYITNSTLHKGYDYSDKFDIKSKVAYKVQSMFKPYTRKIQKRNKNKKLIRINTI